MSDTNNEREQQLFDSWFWKRYGRKPDMHGNDGDCGRWSAWLGRAHLKQEPALLLQDENSGREGRRYNEWHASRPDARMNAREAAAALTPHPETPAPLRGEVEAKAAAFDEVRRSCVLRDVATTIGALMDTMDGVLARHLAAPMPQSAVVTDEQLDELMPEPDEKGESWRDEYGYEKYDYYFNRAQVREAMRAVLALAPGLSGWQEIASAPKDSKARLVWEPRDKNIFCVTWSDGYGDEPKPGWYIFGVGGWNTSPIAAPTHWMQLPPAPGLAPHQPQPEPTSKGAMTEDEFMTARGCPPRKFVRYGDCQCILTQYCDGTCNPIYEDPEPSKEAGKVEAVTDERQPSDGDYLRWAEQAGAKVNWDFESASSARVVFLTASQWGRFCDKVRALYLHPSQPEPTSKGIAKMTQAEFIEWFGKNYYGEVVFGDPEWHAKSIYRRLVREQQ